MKKAYICIFTCALLTLTGCQSGNDFMANKTQDSSPGSHKAAASLSTKEPEKVEIENKTPTASSKTPKPSNAAPGKVNTKTLPPDKEDVLRGKLILIDPGHQKITKPGKEPIAPSSSEEKNSMDTGTSGVNTGTPEYKLNLAISEKLRTHLEKCGAKVSLTWEDTSISLTNIERAKIANSLKADIFIRIHADGSDSPSTHGISVLYPGSKYITDENMRKKSKLIAQSVLKKITSETGASSRGIVERNDLTGLNWCKVPCILVETGFMTNRHEDELLESDKYQDKVATGIVNGLADYFQNGGM
ncbi:MAG TPA: N-acetylmuramoyl-L-alanine amidase [Clostridia bacterium]